MDLTGIGSETGINFPMSEWLKDAIARGVLFFAITFSLGTIVISISTALGKLDGTVAENLFMFGGVLLGFSIFMGFLAWLEERERNGSSK